MAKNKAEKKDAVKGKAKKGEGHTAKTAEDERDASAPGKELSGKDYNRELKKLHVELVKLQEWVVHKGLKVCIVFEGRDGAGKGGTIKAITERVSPRVFRVVALPDADRAREDADVRAALPAAPAGGRRGRDLGPQLVQPRRRRAGDGLLHRGSREALPEGRCRDSRSSWSIPASSCSSTGWR